MTRQNRHSPSWLDLPMLVVIIIWGANLALIKIALQEMPYLPFNGIRLSLSSLVLVSFLLVREKSLAVERRDWGKILLLSLSGLTLYQLLFIRALDLTSAANTGLIFGTSPIAIALISTFFKHERLRPAGWLGIIIGFAGVCLVIAARSAKFTFSLGYLGGDLLLLAAVLLWAHYSVSARPLLKKYSPLRFTALTMGLGTLFLLPFTMADIIHLHYGAISLKSWLCLAYSGILAMALGPILWFRSVQKVGNTRTAVYSNFQPILATLFAHYLVNEKISNLLVLGAAIILLGVYLTRRGQAAGALTLPPKSPAVTIEEMAAQQTVGNSNGEQRQTGKKDQ